jgi:hypothetical protein
MTCRGRAASIGPERRRPSYRPHGFNWSSPPGYQASVDSAPGADDDASGVAGVLSTARALLGLDAALSIPRREIRFVLFNAEEHGLVGSRPTPENRLSSRLRSWLLCRWI